MIEIPVKTISTLNAREHWAVKAKRAKKQRAETHWACKSLNPVKPPLVITLTRIGTRKLDSDNLQGALKSVRDGVADWLGIDDGSDLLKWEYAQEKGPYAVRIEINEVGSMDSDPIKPDSPQGALL